MPFLVLHCIVCWEPPRIYVTEKCSVLRTVLTDSTIFDICSRYATHQTVRCSVSIYGNLKRSLPKVSAEGHSSHSFQIGLLLVVCCVSKSKHNMSMYSKVTYWDDRYRANANE